MKEERRQKQGERRRSQNFGSNYNPKRCTFSQYKYQITKKKMRLAGPPFGLWSFHDPAFSMFSQFSKRLKA